MISKIQDIPTENQISMVYFDTLKDDDTPIKQGFEKCQGKIMKEFKVHLFLIWNVLHLHRP